MSAQTPERPEGGAAPAAPPSGLRPSAVAQKPTPAPEAAGPGRVASTSLPCLTVDPAAPAPVGEQLVSAVLAAVAAGGLARGDRLPPVRALAAELGLAPGTVAKAYRGLEARGVLETRGRAGTFVSAVADTRADDAQQAARRYLDEVVGRLGYTPAQALEWVRSAVAARG